MELNANQLEKFKKIHEKYGCFDDLQDDQIRRIATGTANYYRHLFKIYRNTPLYVVVSIEMDMYSDEIYNVSVTRTVLPDFMYSANTGASKGAVCQQY